MKDLVFWKGRLIRGDQALLPALNSALLYGEAIVETFPIYGGNPFFWKEHFHRLQTGCKYLGWTIPSVAQIKKPLVFFRKELKDRDYLARFCLLQVYDRAPLIKESFPDVPEILASVRALRHDPRRPEPPEGKAGIGPFVVGGSEAPKTFKSPFYLATRSVYQDHPEWDEFLRLNDQGEVVDGALSSPLWFDGKKVWAPPLELGGLTSVTREKILVLCLKLGVPVIQKPWKPKDVMKKGELFFVGSGVGILSITQLQKKRLHPLGLALRLWLHFRQWTQKTGKKVLF